MRFSLVTNSWWIRFRYPDTGVFRMGLTEYTYNGRQQRRREWKQVWPKYRQPNAA